MNQLHATSSRLFWPVAVVVGAAFFVTGHDWNVSLLDAYTGTEDEMEAAASGGNSVRRAAFLGLAAMGVVLLVVRGHSGAALRAVNSRRGVSCHSASGRGYMARVTPLLLFASWCGFSVMWSDDPSMTIRRLSVLGCLTVAACGLLRHFALRDLVRLALVVSAAYLSIGIVAELRNGTFQPASSSFRFAGTVHPNTQGLNLAILCLSSFCLARGGARGRVWLYGLFVIGLLFLVLTKSRTSLAGLVVALALVWTIRTAMSTKLTVGLTGVWLACAALLVSILAGVDAGGDLSQMALLGRGEEADSLTGRVPLWTELSNWIAVRPLTGYGYDSFWTADRIDAVSAELTWGIREAHSAYIDWVLSIGLIGAGLLVVWVLNGMWRAAVLFRATQRPELGFVFGWTVFCLINACTESAMMMPLHATFVAASGLVSALLTPASAFAPLLQAGSAGHATVREHSRVLLPGRAAVGGLS